MDRGGRSGRLRGKRVEWFNGCRKSRELLRCGRGIRGIVMVLARNGGEEDMN